MGHKREINKWPKIILCHHHNLRVYNFQSRLEAPQDVCRSSLVLEYIWQYSLPLHLYEDRKELLITIALECSLQTLQWPIMGFLKPSAATLRARIEHQLASAPLTATNRLPMPLLDSLMRFCQTGPNAASHPPSLCVSAEMKRGGKIIAGKGFTNRMKRFHGKQEPPVRAGLNYNAKPCSNKVPSSSQMSFPPLFLNKKLVPPTV